MPAERAHITSVDALRDFRANLIVYLSKARPTLEEVSADVHRTRTWLEYDHRLHLEGQLKRRAKELEQAKQDLFNAQLKQMREASAAVQKAKRAFDEAEEKLKLLKRRTRDFDHQVGPLVKQLEKLQTMMANDLPKAVAYLGQAAETLEAYADVSAAKPPSKPNPPAEPQAENATGDPESAANTPS